MYVCMYVCMYICFSIHAYAHVQFEQLHKYKIEIKSIKSGTHEKGMLAQKVLTS